MIYGEQDIIELCVDEETGEFNENLYNSLMMDRESKLENLAIWCKEKEAEIENIRAEEKKLRERRETAQNSLEWRKKFLQLQLAGEKLNTARAVVRYHTTRNAVRITDESSLPAWCYKEKTVREVSKTEIKKELMKGKEVPGAILEDRKSVVIS